MKEIIEDFPETSRAKYQAAAQKFRLPYWDYYRPRGSTKAGSSRTFFPGITLGDGTTSSDYDFSIPKIFLEEKVMCRTPQKNDGLEPIVNPLLSFKYPKAHQM